jgi:hypothetical protein
MGQVRSSKLGAIEIMRGWLRQALAAKQANPLLHQLYEQDWSASLISAAPKIMVQCKAQ